MKRSAVSGSGVSPDSKQARGDNLAMAASSPLNEESIQEEIEESKNVQSAITANLILKTYTISLKISKAPLRRCKVILPS